MIKKVFSETVLAGLLVFSLGQFSAVLAGSDIGCDPARSTNTICVPPQPSLEEQQKIQIHTLNPNGTDTRSQCVGAKTHFVVTTTPDLIGKTIFWSSNFGNGPTPEAYSSYDHTVQNKNGYGFWETDGRPWDNSQIGPWTKFATIGDYTNWVPFNVVDCGSGNGGNGLNNGNNVPKGDFDLAFNYQTCVGQTPVYSILGRNVSSQTAQWYSNHGSLPTTQTSFTVGSNNGWTSGGRAWTMDDLGSWTKSVSINGTMKQISFTVTDCSSLQGLPALPANSLQWNSAYCVGQSPTYTLRAGQAFASKQIIWESSDNHSVTSQRVVTLDSNGNFTGNGSQWTLNDVGSWKKTIRANGSSIFLAFTVRDCSTANTFTLTFNNKVCVGETPAYYIQSNSAWAGKNGVWSSTFRISTQKTFTLDSNGNWSGGSGAWTTQDIGHWVKAATINGISKRIEFDVRRCNF